MLAGELLCRNRGPVGQVLCDTTKPLQGRRQPQGLPVQLAAQLHEEEESHSANKGVRERRSRAESYRAAGEGGEDRGRQGPEG